VASLVVCFNFVAAFFALKRWHCSSQQNTTAEHNNFARGGLYIKATDVMAFNGAENISNEAKEYSKALLTVGNLGIVLWIMLGAVACWFFNPLLGLLFLVAAVALIFAVLRRMGCSSCYYCKSCTMGFGKLADLFFGEGYMAGVKSSRTLKIIFVYILLGVIPIAFITVSVIQDFAATKIAVLAVLLVLLLYSGSRRPR